MTPDPNDAEYVMTTAEVALGATLFVTIKLVNLYNEPRLYISSNPLDSTRALHVTN